MVFSFLDCKSEKAGYSPGFNKIIIEINGTMIIYGAVPGSLVRMAAEGRAMQ